MWILYFQEFLLPLRLDDIVTYSQYSQRIEVFIIVKYTYIVAPLARPKITIVKK